MLGFVTSVLYLALTSRLVIGNEASRRLQESESPIQLITPGIDKVTVEINPTFVAPCVEEGDVTPIVYFFATYRDPISGDETCDHTRRIDTCYSQQLEVGCDPETNTATVRVYARSNTLSRSDRVPNPKVGRWCFPQRYNRIGRARMVEATFQCTPSYDPCESDDNCSAGTFCSLNVFPDGIFQNIPYYGSPFPEEEGSRLCIPYTAIGDVCASPFGPSTQCDPDAAFCRGGDLGCTGLQDESGVCRPLGDSCAEVGDANCDPIGEYCDVAAQVCKPRLEDGMCCSSDEECPLDYRCSIFNVPNPFGEAPIICRGPCTDDFDCFGEEEFCLPAPPGELRYCGLSTV